MSSRVPRFVFACGLIAFVVSAFDTNALAQTNTITYNGRLTGIYSFLTGPTQLRFRLYGSITGGGQIGPTLTVNNVNVLAGTFSVPLAFGPSAFPGADRFIEVDVKKPIGPGFDTLAPRQPVNSSPYAVRALSAISADSFSGNCLQCVTDANIATVSGSKVTGPVTDAQNAANALTAASAVNAVNAQNAVAAQDSQKLGGISASQYLLVNGDGSQLTNVSATVADGSITAQKVADGSITFPKLGFSFMAVSRDGNGSGVITSTPSGISCGATCLTMFDIGLVANLSAVPQQFSVFVGWSGACVGTGSCLVEMDGGIKSVSATFVRSTFALSVSGSGGGAVTSVPAGVYCGISCFSLFNGGEIVALIAVPNAGSTFAGWSGACSGTDTICNVTMDGNKSAIATFVP